MTCCQIIVSGDFNFTHWSLVDAWVKKGDEEENNNNKKILRILYKFSLGLTILANIRKNRPLYVVWQYGLWSFQVGGTKLERFLPKNQHTQRTLLNFENWVSGEMSKIGHHFSE